jgi:hypothetical protein
MHEWLDSWFAWPGGGIWSNVAASALTTGVGLTWHHRKMKQHVTAAVQQAATSKESDDHRV